MFNKICLTQSGLIQPVGMVNMAGEKTDWFLAVDHAGNMTYFMDINWTDGTLKFRQEFISVPYPDRIDISDEKIVVLSRVCCDELDVFNKFTIYDLSGNLMHDVTHLPNGEKIQEPVEIALDPRGNILLSDDVLGTFVLSGSVVHSHWSRNV